MPPDAAATAGAMAITDTVDERSSSIVTDWSPLAACLADPPDTMRIAVYARDLATGSTLEVDGDRIVPSASTIKTLILVAIARAIDAGATTTDTPVTITPEMRVPGSGVLNWLHEGITLPARDLAWLMIAISDNTASNAMIATAGLETIQRLAEEMKVDVRLERPFLGHPPGDDRPVNRLTARGLTDLLAAIWHDTAASPERCAWMRRLLADQQHRNRLPRHLPDGVEYAGKTGTLHGISHDCGVLRGPSGAIAVSVLVESDDVQWHDDDVIGRIGRAVAVMVA